MTEAFVPPRTMRQCPRCNNFWPHTPPFYELHALYCAACAPKTVIPTNPTHAAWAKRKAEEEKAKRHRPQKVGD